jgi:hypothetical protein
MFDLNEDECQLRDSIPDPIGRGDRIRFWSYIGYNEGEPQS